MANIRKILEVRNYGYGGIIFEPFKSNVDKLEGKAFEFFKKIENKFGENWHLDNKTFPDCTKILDLKSYEIYLQHYGTILKDSNFDEIFFPDLFGGRNYMARINLSESDNISKIRKNETGSFDDFSVFAKGVDDSYEIVEVIKKHDPTFFESISSDAETNFHIHQNFRMRYIIGYYPYLSSVYDGDNFFSFKKWSSPMEGEEGLLQKYFKELDFENKRKNNFYSAVKLLNLLTNKMIKKYDHLL